MRLRASEWIVVAYFLYLAGAGAVLHVNRRQRYRVVAAALTVVTVVFTLAMIATPASALRDWVPLAYVLLGYWLPGLLVTATNANLERTLLTLDQRLLRITNTFALSERVSRPLFDVFELAYLFCYPMVPLGLASLYAAGLPEESNRFWTAIFTAVFGCYGLLPLLPTRPPRAIEGQPTRSAGAIRRLNLKVLGTASIQLNTFPSGHAAASVATALAVGARLPAIGLALGLLAFGIAVGSVAGRYHYAADAVAGAMFGLAGFLISRLV